MSICVYFYQCIRSLVSLPPELHVHDFKKYIQLKQQHNNTCSFKVFHNDNWGKMSYYPVLPSTAISKSIAQPGKTQVLPPRFYHLGFPWQFSFANLGLVQGFFWLSV